MPFLTLMTIGLAQIDAKLPDIRSVPTPAAVSIPSEYRGRWCLTSGAGPSDKDLAQIVVGAGTLHIYGEDEHARRVSHRDDRTLIVQFVDEVDGTVFDLERQFKLSADGRELRLRSEDDDDTTTFAHCPR